MICDYPVETATIRERKWWDRPEWQTVCHWPPFHVTSDVFLGQSMSPQILEPICGSCCHSSYALLHPCIDPQISSPRMTWIESSYNTIFNFLDEKFKVSIHVFTLRITAMNTRNLLSLQLLPRNVFFMVRKMISFHPSFQENWGLIIGPKKGSKP